MKELFVLLIAFCKVGALTFGGGYAMLPIVTRELAENRGWISEEEIADYYAVGQCLPGIIAANTAGLIGYKRKGVPGAIFSMVGVALPSLVIIILIAAFIQNFAHLAAVQHAFAGIRIAVCALVIGSLITLVKKGVVDWLTLAIGIGALAAVALLSLSPAYVVVVAAVLGILGKRIRMKREDKRA